MEQLDTRESTKKTTENKSKQLKNNLDNFKQAETDYNVKRNQSKKISNNWKQPKTTWTTATTWNNSENILKQPRTTLKRVKQR